MGLSRGLSPVLRGIGEDFEERLPGYHKSRREGLVTLAAVMVETRSANLMELAASLPRKIGSKDHRYQYISRLLGNAKINCDEVMAVYAGEIFARLAAQGQTIVMMLDQSKVNDFNEVLMVSVRIAQRALPVAWRVRRTRGNIGFATQQDLLNEVRGWLPADACVMLAADRFYGTAKLIGWCQDAGWGYRIRLKGNLSLGHDSGEMTTGEAVALMPGGLEGPSSRARASSPTSDCCTKRATRSPGSSPWTHAPASTPLSIMACAGASSRCSRTSSRAASGSCKATSKGPNASNGSSW